jgi:signal transduction histidine kinase
MFEGTLKRTPRRDTVDIPTSRLEKYLTTQHAITQIIASSAELEQALPGILQAICETAGWDFGEVWYVDRSDNRLYCEATWHNPSLSFPEFGKSGWDITFAPGKGLPGRVWASNRCAWITDILHDGNFLRTRVARHDGLHGGLGIPIRSEGEVIGALTFFSRQPRRPDWALLQVLDTIGSHTGLFIERKRAERLEREQARRLAAMEERQRLARDLHDSVTQTLFSASVIAEMLPILWTRDPEQIKPNLDELHQLTRGALDEMRALLVELRPPAEASSDLPELLKNLIDTLRKRANIEVTLDVHLPCPLPADMQTTLYRIAQEALNNVAKHADATQVAIQLWSDASRIELAVRDNGRGFNSACVPAGHFGLAIMHERASLIGAACHIESAPGSGTCLRVTRSSAVQEI